MSEGSLLGGNEPSPTLRSQCTCRHGLAAVAEAGGLRLHITFFFIFVSFEKGRSGHIDRLYTQLQVCIDEVLLSSLYNERPS